MLSLWRQVPELFNVTCESVSAAELLSLRLVNSEFADEFVGGHLQEQIFEDLLNQFKVHAVTWTPESAAAGGGGEKVGETKKKKRGISFDDPKNQKESSGGDDAFDCLDMMPDASAEVATLKKNTKAGNETVLVEAKTAWTREKTKTLSIAVGPSIVTTPYKWFHTEAQLQAFLFAIGNHEGGGRQEVGKKLFSLLEERHFYSCDDERNRQVKVDGALLLFSKASRITLSSDLATVQSGRTVVEDVVVQCVPHSVRAWLRSNYAMSASHGFLACCKDYADYQDSRMKNETAPPAPTTTTRVGGCLRGPAMSTERRDHYLALLLQGVAYPQERVPTTASSKKEGHWTLDEEAPQRISLPILSQTQSEKEAEENLFAVDDSDVVAPHSSSSTLGIALPIEHLPPAVEGRTLPGNLWSVYNVQVRPLFLSNWSRHSVMLTDIHLCGELNPVPSPETFDVRSPYPKGVKVVLMFPLGCPGFKSVKSIAISNWESLAAVIAKKDATGGAQNLDVIFPNLERLTLRNCRNLADCLGRASKFNLVENVAKVSEWSELVSNKRTAHVAENLEVRNAELGWVSVLARHVVLDSIHGGRYRVGNGYKLEWDFADPYCETLKMIQTDHPNYTKFSEFHVRATVTSKPKNLVFLHLELPFVVEIGNHVFHNCEHLKRVVFRKMLKCDVIGDHFLEDCPRLESIEGFSPVASPSCMQRGARVSVDCSVGAQGRGSSVAAAYTENAWPVLRLVGSHFLAGARSLLHIDASFPQLAGLGASAFSGCRLLRTVELSTPNLIRIGANAFRSCHQLRKVHFHHTGSRVNQVDCGLCSDCPKLRHFVMDGPKNPQDARPFWRDTMFMDDSGAFKGLYIPPAEAEAFKLSYGMPSKFHYFPKTVEDINRRHRNLIGFGGSEWKIIKTRTCGACNDRVVFPARPKQVKKKRVEGVPTLASSASGEAAQQSVDNLAREYRRTEPWKVGGLCFLTRTLELIGVLAKGANTTTTTAETPPVAETVFAPIAQQIIASIDHRSTKAAHDMTSGGGYRYTGLDLYHQDPDKYIKSVSVYNKDVQGRQPMPTCQLSDYFDLVFSAANRRTQSTLSVPPAQGSSSDLHDLFGFRLLQKLQCPNCESTFGRTTAQDHYVLAITVDNLLWNDGATHKISILDLVYDHLSTAAHVYDPSVELKCPKCQHSEWRKEKNTKADDDDDDDDTATSMGQKMQPNATQEEEGVKQEGRRVVMMEKPAPFKVLSVEWIQKPKRLLVSPSVPLIEILDDGSDVPLEKKTTYVHTNVAAAAAAAAATQQQKETETKNTTAKEKKKLRRFVTPNVEFEFPIDRHSSEVTSKPGTLRFFASSPSKPTAVVAGGKTGTMMASEVHQNFPMWFEQLQRLGFDALLQKVFGDDDDPKVKRKEKPQQSSVSSFDDDAAARVTATLCSGAPRHFSNHVYSPPDAQSLGKWDSSGGITGGDRKPPRKTFKETGLSTEDQRPFQWRWAPYGGANEVKIVALSL